MACEGVRERAYRIPVRKTRVSKLDIGPALIEQCLVFVPTDTLL